MGLLGRSWLQTCIRKERQGWQFDGRGWDLGCCSSASFPTRSERGRPEQDTAFGPASPKTRHTTYQDSSPCRLETRQEHDHPLQCAAAVPLHVFSIASFERS